MFIKQYIIYLNSNEFALELQLTVNVQEYVTNISWNLWGGGGGQERVGKKISQV
jgi:hypothetical protein